MGRRKSDWRTNQCSRQDVHRHWCCWGFALHVAEDSACANDLCPLRLSHSRPDILHHPRYTRAETLPALMRRVISAQSPHVFVARTKTLDAQLNDSLARERFQTFVLIAFGASALLLAVLGIYGVLSYSVAARKQEIGLRMALGARRSSVYALTMLEAGSPVAGGLAAGLAVSFWIVRLIEKFLYGARAVDLLVIACVVLLFAAAHSRRVLPARHAASVNPMDALRPD